MVQMYNLINVVINGTNIANTVLKGRNIPPEDFYHNFEDHQYVGNFK